MEHLRFPYQVYFKSPDKAKEYLLINHLIKNEYQVISGMYNYDDGVIIFTVPNQDRRTVDKFDMKPYYVLCSVYKLSLVLFCFEDDGVGSTLLQHWFHFQKSLKKRTKNGG